jgi:hypothetical protein
MAAKKKKSIKVANGTGKKTPCKPKARANKKTRKA